MGSSIDGVGTPPIIAIVGGYGGPGGDNWAFWPEFVVFCVHVHQHASSGNALMVLSKPSGLKTPGFGTLCFKQAQEEARVQTYQLRCARSTRRAYRRPVRHDQDVSEPGIDSVVDVHMEER